MELVASFHGNDEVEAATPEGMAKALSETMRKSPVDDKVKLQATKTKTASKSLQILKCQIKMAMCQEHERIC